MNRSLPCIHQKDCVKCFNSLGCPHYDTGEDRTDYDEYEPDYDEYEADYDEYEAEEGEEE